MEFQIQGYAVPGTTVYYKNNIAISLHAWNTQYETGKSIAISSNGNLKLKN